MKILKTTFQLILIIFISFFMIGCNSDDDTTTGEPETIIKLYKKSEKYASENITFDKTVEYDSENKIQSIINKNYGYNTQTISVERVNSTISITDETVFDNSPIEWYISFDVTIETNKIVLTSESQRIEIMHSNGYVDSTKQTNISDSSVVFEESFTRDSNMNIMSMTYSNGVFSSMTTYTNFDSNKMAAPYDSIITYNLSDYIRIFDLKVTKNNPKTAIQNFEDGSSNTSNKYLKYDDFGYVIKTSYDESFTLGYVDHQYIELQ